MRRIIRLAVLIMLLQVVAAFGTTSSASARSVSLADAAPYTGYVHVHECQVQYVASWRWSARGWSHEYLPVGRRVWVTPYASGWYWVWIGDGAWRAVPSSQLLWSDSYSFYAACTVAGGGRRISG